MAHRLNPALVAALVLAMLAAPSSMAQGRGGFHGSPHFTPGYGQGRNGSAFFNQRRSGFPGAYLSGWPFFYDYPLDPATAESAPPVVYVQPPFAAPSDTPQPKLSPLLIELEGDQYVRHGGVPRSSENDTRESAAGGARQDQRLNNQPYQSSGRKVSNPPQPATRTELPRAGTTGSPAPAAAASLAPTILVYRDGHREQVPDYAIVGRVLYAHEGCGADSALSVSANCDAAEQPAYGMKSIQVSALDLPATMKANRENGVNFVLPAGPNEVVTRP